MGAWASRGLIKPRVSRGRWAPASRPPGPRRLRPPGARASGTPRQLGPHRRPAAAPRGGIRAAPAPSPSGSAPASGARGRALRPGRPLRRVRLEGGDATHPTRGDERRRSRPVSGSQGRRGGGGGAGTRGAGRFPAQPRPAAPRLRRPSSGRRSGAGPEGARSESPPPSQVCTGARARGRSAPSPGHGLHCGCHQPRGPRGHLLSSPHSGVRSHPASSCETPQAPFRSFSQPVAGVKPRGRRRGS